MAREAHAYLHEALQIAGEPETWQDATTLVLGVAAKLGSDRHRAYGPNNIALQDDPVLCPCCGENVFGQDEPPTLEMQLLALAVRMNDKLKRFMTMTRTGLQDQEETVVDSAVDFINYACYMVMLLQQSPDGIPWWFLVHDHPVVEVEFQPDGMETS